MSIGYAFHIDPAAVFAWPADLVHAAVGIVEEVAAAAEQAADRARKGR